MTALRAVSAQLNATVAETVLSAAGLMMRTVAGLVPEEYSSVLLRRERELGIKSELPPAISTLPFGSSVAVAESRALFITAVDAATPFLPPSSPSSLLLLLH